MAYKTWKPKNNNYIDGWNASQGHTHSITPSYFKVYAWYRTA